MARTLFVQPALGAPAALALANLGTVSNQGRLLLLGANWKTAGTSRSIQLGCSTAEQHRAAPFRKPPRVCSSTTAPSPAWCLFFIFCGRVSGRGGYTGNVTFGELTFEPQQCEPSPEALQRQGLLSGAAPAGTSFQTGTVRFMGVLRLNAGAALRLKFSENGGNDKLFIGGALVDGGGQMERVFPTHSAPGLDQVFSFYESTNGWNGAFELNAPAGSGLRGAQRRGAVFNLPGAAEFTADDSFTHEGVVKNRAGAEFTTRGRLGQHTKLRPPGGVR